MTYVITEPCVNTKDGSCIEVCPVDCIHPTREEAAYHTVDMLYIDPSECIDCDACVDACPVGAPLPLDAVPEDWREYIDRNSRYFVQA